LNTITDYRLNVLGRIGVGGEKREKGTRKHGED